MNCLYFACDRDFNDITETNCLVVQISVQIDKLDTK